MNDDYYKNLILNSDIAYSLHKIILDEFENPIDFIYLEVNKMFLQLVQKSEEEVINKSFTEVFQTDKNNPWIQVIGKVALNSESTQVKIFSETMQKWLRVKITSHQKYFCSSLFVDITDEKLKEKELEEEKAQLNYILEGTKAGTWKWNMQTGETIYNKYWFKIIGIEEVNSVQKNVDYFLNLIHPEDLNRLNEAIDSYLKGKIDDVNSEYRMKHKSGTWVWVESRGKIAKWTPDGKPLWMYGTNIDITDKKKYELELLEKDKAKSSFLAHMSHELRTPLNGVIGFSEILKNSNLEEKEKTIAEDIYTSAQSLLGIINDILDFSKIEAQKLELDLVPTNLSILLNEVLRIVKFQANSKNLDISLVQTELNTLIIVDPTRLKQILINLLSNAIKFTKIGSINFTMNSNQISESEIELYFSVKDTGIGISLENQAKLFQPFTQADSSISRNFGGTGLGLAITNSLLELMGSNLNLKSEIGIGTEFFFSLRAKISDSVIDSENIEIVSKAESMLKYKILKILLVDDFEMNIKLLKVLLKKIIPNAIILEAKNGQEAIQLFIDSKPDLILMDIQMPILDGYLATQKIRELETDIRTPIIALTANALKEEREHCIEVGMDEYFTKPIQKEKFKEFLVQFLTQ
ncbi:MAG: ATP-binding protein [Leptospiraceae bacterium]|nr:ATP-binding protein [Leptospiraceae bacterium]